MLTLGLGLGVPNAPIKGVPGNALRLNGKPITLNGQYITLRAS